MNRRNFFGTITKALAGAALYAHLEFHSLVPVATVFQSKPEISSFADLRNLIEFFKARMGKYPPSVHLTHEEWNHLTGTVEPDPYPEYVKPIVMHMGRESYEKVYNHSDIICAPKAQCEAGIHNFAILSVNGNFEAVYFPDAEAPVSPSSQVSKFWISVSRRLSSDSRWHIEYMAARCMEKIRSRR